MQYIDGKNQKKYHMAYSNCRHSWTSPATLETSGWPSPQANLNNKAICPAKNE